MSNVFSIQSSELSELVRTAISDASESAAHLTDEDFIGYAAAVLSDSDVQRIEAHASNCAQCAEELLRLSVSNSQITSTLDSEICRTPKSTTSEEVFLVYEEDQSQREIESLLTICKAVESECDYVLPNGLHVDTHINVARVCQSEETMDVVARHLARQFQDTIFDSVVSHGWTMAMIARRMRSRFRDAGRPLRICITEGYKPVTLLSALRSQSQAVILTDVMVTGELISHLADLVRLCGSHIVGAGSIAKLDIGAMWDQDEFPRRSLFVKRDFQTNYSSDCPRCGVLPRVEFNPVACSMTLRRSSPRALSEFFAEYPEAERFWTLVDAADACSRHYVENDTHYIGFVDVAKLLGHPTVGHAIVSELHQRLTTLEVTTILAPRRPRAKQLVGQLDSFAKKAGDKGYKVVFAEMNKEDWVIPATSQTLRNESVAVIDSAIGHGGTVDSLQLLANRQGASRVSIATVLSRLSESQEGAFGSLLNGRFCALFHFPMRPLALNVWAGAFCPACIAKRQLVNDAAQSKARALEELALPFTLPPRRDALTRPAFAKGQMDLPGMVERPLLVTCSKSVAAGIALNAVHASRNNGMAPLGLPEIADQTIPAKNRAAILESLPTGIVRWSGRELTRQLEAHLENGPLDAAWAAAADVLARETGSDWIRIFLRRMEGQPQQWHEGTRTTWNKICHVVHKTIRRDFALRSELYSYLQNVGDHCHPTGIPESVSKLQEVVEKSQVEV